MPSRYLEVFRSRRLAVILLLGFSSGLPLALTGGTLQAWMTVEGVDLSTIGVFTLVGLPYVWKFLWAPAMDRCVPRRARANRRARCRGLSPGDARIRSSRTGSGRRVGVDSRSRVAQHLRP